MRTTERADRLVIEMSEDAELEDWVDYLIAGFGVLIIIAGTIVVGGGIVWVLSRILATIPDILMGAHRFAYTLTDPLYVGFVYGIVLSYIVYRGRERWGDRRI
ncbi:MULTISPECIES: hypothetical protein [unclassified Haloarcula]|uniref:hypothetical protein n=1 Tax=unclassified Haloarcula TaxID=2624677 RepID=UPI00124799F3|nr:MULTISPECIES: hypothetical protein [unclassified Haloarcula]